MNILISILFHLCILEGDEYIDDIVSPQHVGGDEYIDNEYIVSSQHVGGEAGRGSPKIT